MGCAFALALVGVFVYGYLPLYGVSNIWRLDGLVQHFPALYHYNEVLRAFLANPSNGFEMWSWKLGLGSDNLGSLSYYTGDPFALISLAFPMGMLEYAYEWLFFLRLLLAGVAAYAYMRQMRSTAFGATAGSLVYVFTTFTMFSALRHPYFANPMVFLPLVLLGIERTLERKRPYVLVIAVLLAAMSSFYFFYQIAIVSVLYAVARYLEVTPKGERLAGLIPAAVGVGGVYAIGAALGAFLLVPALTAFFSSSRAGVSQPFGLFFDLDIYRSYVAGLTSSILSANSVFAGFSVVGFVVLPVLFMRRGHHSTLKFMLAAFPVFLIFPFFGTAFNGFAFPSYRFVFMWGLFLGTAVATVLSERRACKGREIAATALGFTVFSAFTIGALGILDPKILMPLAIGALVVFALAVESLLAHLAPTPMEIAEQGLRPSSKRAYSPLLRWTVLGLLVFNIISNGAFSFSLGFSDRLADYMPFGTTLPAYLSGPGAQAGRLAPEGIERIDKQDTVFATDLKMTGSNDALVQGYDGISYYYSVLNGGVQDYLAGLDNRSMRTAFDYNGLDDRAALDTLNGVRYYLAGERGTRYVPYGFAPVSQDDTITVYANRYALPLGYVYHSAVASATYAALKPLEKQQALLQGVVLEDGDVVSLPRIEPELAIVDVPYSVSAEEGASFSQSARHIVTTEQFGQIDLSFAPVPNSELYIDLTGIRFKLVRMASDAAMVSRAESVIAAIAEPPDPTFIKRVDSLHVAFGTHGPAKTERSEDAQYEYYWGDTSMLVNLGYSQVGTDSAYVRIVEPASVRYDDLRVYAVPMDRFAEQVGRLSAEGMRDIRTGVNTVSATVTARGDGLLFLSIPYSPGWTATVDGKPAPIVRANVGFSGVAVPDGRHAIELRYRTPGLAVGVALSRWALVAFVVLVIGHEGRAIVARRRRTRALVASEQDSVDGPAGPELS